MRDQKYCVIWVYAGLINAVIGPFDTFDEATSVAGDLQQRHRTSGFDVRMINPW